MNFTASSPVGLAAAREGVAALRARAWLVGLLVVIGAVIGFLSASGGQSANVYRAWLSAEPLGANRAVTELGISTPEGPQAADFLDGAVLTRLERTTGKSYEFLIEHLTLSQPPTGAPNPPVLLIPKVDSTPESKALLTAWLAAVHAVRTAHVQAVLARGELSIRKELARAQRHGLGARAAELSEHLTRMGTLRSSLTSDVAIFKKPREIMTSSPSKPRATAIGALVGLIAAVAIALAIALVDGRLRTRDGLEAGSGLELLADLRAEDGVPSLEHTRARLRALGGGAMPSPIVCLPCGSVDVGEVEARVAKALGDEAGVKVVPRLGAGEGVDQVVGAAAVIVAARPGKVRRTELADLRAELAGIVEAPIGLAIV